MRKTISFLLAVLMIFNICAVNVFAANGQGSVPSRTDTVNVNDYSTDNWMRFTFNYGFESGPDTKDTFGVPTQTDAAAYNPELENVRRNKDAAFLPPSYGVFSGEIPTNPSSLYHSNVKPDYAGNITNYSNTINSYGGTLSSSASSMSDTGMLASTSTMQPVSTQNTNAISEILISQTTNYSNYLLTQANLYEDGSLGTIKIPRLNLTVKVFEGETIDNMKRGVGHFEFTSAWDGNVGIAGHNRGSSAYMSGIWNLRDGDEIIFTTKYGQRTYTVFSKEKISDTDYSKLGWSNENIITLITCVENQPSLRWAIQGIAAK